MWNAHLLLLKQPKCLSFPLSGTWFLQRCAWLSPPSLRRTSQRSLLNLSIQKSHHLDILSLFTWYSFCLLTKLSEKGAYSLLCPWHLGAEPGCGRSGVAFNKYEARLVIRMLCALLRLLYNILIKNRQVLKGNKWQKKKSRVARATVGVYYAIPILAAYKSGLDHRTGVK